MKLVSIIALALVASCHVKGPSDEAQRETATRRFEPAVVAQEDLDRIKAICDALASKEERLPGLISSAYTLSYSEKGCNDKELGAAKAVGVTIQKPDSIYVFRKANNENFIFPNVETFSSGSMAKICANLSTLVSPFQTSSKGAMWFTTFTRAKDCSSDFESVCIQIDRGELAKNLEYTIHTSEIIRFKISGAQTGFYLDRKLVSLADCDQGKRIERRASLK